MWRLRKLWFEALIRLTFVRGEHIGACRHFVLDPNGSIPIYCRVCGYDWQLHRQRGAV